MATPYGSKLLGTLESEVYKLFGWISVKTDGSSNVISAAPTSNPGAVLPVTVPWTRFKGAEAALTVVDGYGNLVNNPHTATGTYTFTLDQPWVALVGATVTAAPDGYLGSPVDGYGVSPVVVANVTATQSTTTLLNNFLPGTSSNLAPKTVTVYWVNSSNVLTDPHGSFYVELTLKKNNAV